MNIITTTQKLYDTNESSAITDELKEEFPLGVLTAITPDTKITEFKNAHFNTDCYKRRMKDPIALGMFLVMAAQRNNLTLTRFFIKKLYAIDKDPNPNFFYFALSSTILNISEMAKIYPEFEIPEKSLEIIHLLLKAGADVNIALEPLKKDDEFDDSLLSEALEISNLKLVKLFLQYGAKPFYSFDPEKQMLTKQKFSDKENKIYQLAKREIKTLKSVRNLFILGSKEKDNILTLLPRYIIVEILLSGRIVGSNEKKVIQAKRLIEKSKLVPLNVEEKMDSSNALMLTNW